MSAWLLNGNLGFTFQLRIETSTRVPNVNLGFKCQLRFQMSAWNSLEYPQHFRLRFVQKNWSHCRRTLQGRGSYLVGVIRFRGAHIQRGRGGANLVVGNLLLRNRLRPLPCIGVSKIFAESCHKTLCRLSSWVSGQVTSPHSFIRSTPHPSILLVNSLSPASAYWRALCLNERFDWSEPRLTSSPLVHSIVVFIFL